MKIFTEAAQLLSINTPILVIGLHEEKSLSLRHQEINAALDDVLGQAIREQEFSGKLGETLLLHSGKRLAARRILCVGLGQEKNYDTAQARQAIASAAELAQKKRILTLALDLDSFVNASVALTQAAAAATEGIALSAYRYDDFRRDSAKDLAPLLSEALLICASADEQNDVQAAITATQIICASVCLARDLVNAPGNVKSPQDLAERCRTEGEAAGCTCTILHRQALEEEGMGALLGVAQGSMREPCLIILEYRGAGAKAPLALVGKAVVFDSGGISLKPAEKMDEMKMDMAGGAAVLGTITAAARLRLPINLVALIPAVENLPSGHAIRPGDILTSLAKKTIEVLNTDAEGRLILADAITYAQRYQPEALIDVATLTGAAIVALGHHASAILGTDQPLIDALIAAGDRSGERLWQLPLWDVYDQLLKSDVADIKNSGGRPAGTITGAAFLKAFAGEKPWAHLDIAGTAWEEKGRPGTPKGGSGVGVRLLIDFLRMRAEQ
ncbi:MAG: leucyl aminopeptidase [Deltaproteobacteria bacterium HGW-Deltaproteobacteria-4]|nr:MAG: leucyl aminopeptidase [Deltaproteobacteria bacterium HGW-Deltaproteobacteria-4]